MHQGLPWFTSLGSKTASRIYSFGAATDSRKPASGISTGTASDDSPDVTTGFSVPKCMSCMSFKNEDDQPVTKITEEVLKKQGGTLEMIFQASPRVYSNFLGFLNDIMTFK